MFRMQTCFYARRKLRTDEYDYDKLGYIYLIIVFVIIDWLVEGCLVLWCTCCLNFFPF